MNFWAAYALKLLVVALLLAGLYALGRLLRRARFSGVSGLRLVTVVESAMLAPQLWIHVVKVGRRYFFLGAGQGGIATLAELAPEEIDG